MGGLLAVLSTFSLAHGSTLSGDIEDFSLNSCGIKNCITITASKASVGILDGNYGLANAKMLVKNKNQIRKIVEFNSSDLYFDDLSKKVFLRTITERPHSEAYYDLQTEKFYFFKN